MIYSSSEIDVKNLKDKINYFCIFDYFVHQNQIEFVMFRNFNIIVI